MNHNVPAIIQEPTYPTIREVAEIVNESAEITLIFNKHEHSLDAERSVEYIEPNSMVFIEILELYSVDDSQSYTLMESLNYLNMYRQQFGVESDEYNDAKRYILEHVQRVQYIPASSGTDFTQCVARQVELLLQKDCIVQQADARQPMEGDEVFSFRQDIVDKLRNRDLLLYDADDFANGLAKPINKMLVADEDAAYVNIGREVQAVGMILASLYGHILGSHSYKDINSIHGKTPTYVLYGTAHGDSLSERFQIFGVDVSSVEINPVHESSKLVGSPEVFFANKNRRIAHTAFMAFIDDFANIPPDEYRRIREESYNSMRTYNEDPDRAWQFTLTCMQLLQLTYVSDNYRQAQLATNAILSELGIDQSRLGLE